MYLGQLYAVRTPSVPGFSSSLQLVHCTGHALKVMSPDWAATSLDLSLQRPLRVGTPMIRVRNSS